MIDLYFDKMAKTRTEIIQTRSNGLKYFDQAIEKVGINQLIELSIKIGLDPICRPLVENGSTINDFSYHLRWSVVNAIREILPKIPECACTFNLDEAFTQEQIQYMVEQCKLPITINQINNTRRKKE